MENGFSTWVLLISSFAISHAAQAATRYEKVVAHVPGEIVVKLKDSANLMQAQSVTFSSLERRLGARSVALVSAFKTDKTLHVVRLAKDTDMLAAIEALKAEPSVETAEPNYILHSYNDGSRSVTGTPNDPDFEKTWGIRNIGQVDAAGQAGKAGSDVNVVPLWQAGFKGNRKVLVAVIDTGIDWEHPDLKANLYTNPGESGALENNKRDDDRNGFVDDVHGWNFAARTNLSQDDHDHGTHCSGTIGAVGDNGIGVVGVNWEVSLMPLKFLDANGGGSLAGAIEAINYATMMKVNIMSNSWGGGGFSETMKKSIEKARDAGILFVAAAGNDSSSNDSTPAYPASYDIANVISVAATDNRDGLAVFSNHGSKTVHVAAPGVKVYSTTKGGKYEAMSGTSMATPHVSGIAALLWAANPTWTFSDIKSRLIATSVPVRGLSRKVASRGRVNAYNAMHGIVPPSNEPDETLWKTEAESLESAHPYAVNTNTTFKIVRPGAKYIRVHFEKVEVELNYDKVIVENPAGEISEEITGNKAGYMSDYVMGDTAVIRLKSDDTNQGFGFKVDSIQVIY